MWQNTQVSSFRTPHVLIYIRLITLKGDVPTCITIVDCYSKEKNCSAQPHHCVCENITFPQEYSITNHFQGSILPGYDLTSLSQGTILPEYTITRLRQSIILIKHYHQYTQALSKKSSISPASCIGA